MTSSPPTLTAFLAARLDEDQQAAEQAATQGPASWYAVRDGASWRVDDPTMPVIGWTDGGHPGHLQAEHMARHDPARALAEVDAKRQIIEQHPDVNDGDCGTCVRGLWGYPTNGGSTIEPWPCPTLRLLALPYADHPDYQQDWQP
jgi:hypothetical protein